MKKYLLVLLGSLVGFVAPAIADSCDNQFPGGVAPVVTNSKLKNRLQKLCFDEFAVIHSGVFKTPLVVGEHLTRDRILTAQHSKRQDSFHSEERLPAQDRSELNDYRRSGFDRGHMSNFKDQATLDGQYQSFSLANMIPQNPQNNQNLFEGLESAVRDYTKRHGEVYVLTGPLFEGAQLQRIGGRVYVPTSIYKLVYDPQRRVAAAYICANAPGMDYSVISVKVLEARAGINFLPGLSNEVKLATFDLPPPRVHGSKHGSRRQADSQPSSNSSPSFRTVIRTLSEVLGGKN